MRPSKKVDAKWKGWRRSHGIKPDPTYLNLTRVAFEEIYVLAHAAVLRVRHTGKRDFLAGDKKCLREAEALLTPC